QPGGGRRRDRDKQRRAARGTAGRPGEGARDASAEGGARGHQRAQRNRGSETQGEAGGGARRQERREQRP
ncbi:hypothetical protein C3R44_21245, partial [Mycobacterium tuberculosis]